MEKISKKVKLSSTVTKKRDPNLLYSEKELLCQLVRKHFPVIECKKTDGTSSLDKKQAWERLEAEFNSLSALHYRNARVLKGCWENVKKRTKNQFSLQRQNAHATGGGPPEYIPEDPLSSLVADLLTPIISGLENKYDDDIFAVPSQKVEQDGNNAPAVKRAGSSKQTADFDIPNQEVEQDSNNAPAVNRAGSSKQTANFDTILLEHEYTTTEEVMIQDEEEVTLQDEEEVSFVDGEEAPNSTQNSDKGLLLNGDWSTFSAEKLRTPLCPALGKVKPSPNRVSRRRPIVISTNTNEEYVKAKMASLTRGEEMAEEEHIVRMKILSEQLKQEELKTQLLEMEVKSKKS